MAELTADQVLADLQGQLDAQEAPGQNVPDPPPPPAQATFTADDLLQDPYTPAPPSAESEAIRIARLEAENQVLRQYAQPGTQAAPPPSPDSQIAKLNDEINNMRSRLPDANSTDPNVQTQRFLLQNEIVQKQVELQGIQLQSQQAMQQNYQSQLVMNTFKTQAAQTDANFRDPIFVQAFDKYVAQNIPPHLMGNAQVLDLARSKVGYAYLQRKMGLAPLPRQGGLDATSLNAGGKAQQQATAATKKQYTQQELNVFAAYGMKPDEAEKFDKGDEFDLGYVKYTHRL